MRAGLVAAVATCLCCAAPASAAVSGGDSPAGDGGVLGPTGNPSLSGTQQVGQTLTGSDNFSGASDVERGWLRCNNTNGTGCSVIAGQTSSTYTLVDADADKVIKFRALGTNLTGSREADAVSGVIDAISPSNSVLPPTPSGTLRDGQTLTGDTGTWTGTPTIGFSYQWQRCTPGCVDIGGATSSTYVLKPADVSATIRYRVRATRTQNASDTDTANSPQTGAIQPIPTANTGSPQISGIVRQGEVLSAINGSWQGTQPLNYSHVWKRCNPGCNTVVSMTSSYAPTTADVGHQLQLTVTASGAGGAAAVSVLSGTVAPRPVSGGSGGGSTTPTGTTTPGSTTLRRLSPFPVVAIGGRVIGRRVRVSLLRVSRAPRGSVVTVTCRGRGCPFRSARRTIRRRSGLRIKGLERLLRSGTVITIVVRKGNTIGKYTRLRIRRGAPPARIDRCIRPGATLPSKCP